MFPAPEKGKNCLVQFRAGKMNYSNGIVSPDLRQGYLTVSDHADAIVEVKWTTQEADKTLTSTALSWKRGNVEVNFVDKCTTGRVLLFKETQKNEKEALHFFWLQEKSDANDARYLRALKSAVKPLSGGQPVKLEDLKKIIASISSSNNNVGAEVSIPDLVSSSKVAEAVRADPDFYKAQLQGTLPPELASSGSILDQIKNPQVTHAAAVLEAGLKDAQTCKELCKMYGLPEGSAGVAGFLNAIIDQAKKTE